MAQYKKKIVAFIDILGFSEMVRKSESGIGRTLDEIIELQRILENQEKIDTLNGLGADVCPGGDQRNSNLDVQVTQISDCAIYSVEFSEVGAINLISMCYSTVFRLMKAGCLARGYINIGTIYHESGNPIGSGYMTAYNRESKVTYSKKDQNEGATPFVEIDTELVNFIQQSDDQRISSVFKRLCKTDGERFAIYPFAALSSSFTIDDQFDVAHAKKNNETVRSWIQQLRDELIRLTSDADTRALKKIQYYSEALDAQFEKSLEQDKVLNGLTTPWPDKRITRELCPGVFYR